MHSRNRGRGITANSIKATLVYTANSWPFWSNIRQVQFKANLLYRARAKSVWSTQQGQDQSGMLVRTHIYKIGERSKNYLPIFTTKNL